MKKHVTHIVCLILYAIALFVLNKGLDFTRPADYPDGLDYAKAVVTNVIEDEMGQDPDYSYIRIGKQTLEMRITSGEYKGKTIEVMNFVTRTNQTEGTVGTKDGKWTLADLSIALNYYQTTEIAYDINLDGIVNTLDYVLISEYIR